MMKLVTLTYNLNIHPVFMDWDELIKIVFKVSSCAKNSVLRGKR